MNEPSKTNVRKGSPSSRRDFLKHSTAAVVGSSVATNLTVARGAHAGGSDVIRVGLVGCGGRGTRAAVQALQADSGTRLVALADAFQDRVEASLKSLRAAAGDRVDVDRDRLFVGFDGYKGVIQSGVDVVLLATPPHFRPLHLQACIEAGKHVFAEKPVAVDAPGVRSVLETTQLAKESERFIVSGLNSRYSFRLQELMRRIHDGAIGDIIAMHAVRFGGGVWVRVRQPEMTEMEYQMRNWYYFTWLAGDFNVEQFVHQNDLIAWAMQDEYPVHCYGTGGRQARTGEQYGHIYDHFSSVFQYGSGPQAFTTTRHQKNCSNESSVIIMGTKGTARLSRRNPGITGQNPWQPPKTEETDSHQLEHDAFFAGLREGRVINNDNYMANSTMMAIIARMSAYTGQSLTWEQAMKSKQELKPSRYDWNAEPPLAKVAIPGVTKFV